MEETIQFTLNGKTTKLRVDTDRTLLWVLRTDLGLTGTKYGCGEAHCGACTVLLENDAMPSCQLTMKDVAGKSVMTIEGLGQEDNLHPLQQAFMAHDALQCGFCTPGMVMAAYGLLQRTPNPTHEDIIAGMEDNLCRCGAHPRIVKAIQTAAKPRIGGTGQ